MFSTNLFDIQLDLHLHMIIERRHNAQQPSQANACIVEEVKPFNEIVIGMYLLLLTNGEGILCWQSSLI